MNIEKREMGKNDDEKLIAAFKRSNELEKQLKEMSKETLVNIMVFKELMEDAFEPEEHGMNLWYYVADESGVKYITNERPQQFLTKDSKTPIFLTDGDIQMRVPKAMECMFPDIKPGDEPVKVSLSISY